VAIDEEQGMSIFASQVTATHEFVCAPGQSFTVRKMAASELAENRKRYAENALTWADWVIRTCLVSWTFEQAPDGVNGLVDEAVDQITTAAFRLTKPSVFETTPEAAEAEQKND
jgi:hypothetical protein